MPWQLTDIAPGSAVARLSISAACGFTLIEMMIALAVAGILFFVALPAWQHTMLKSNRAAGKGVLVDVLSRQEQYFINNKHYATSLEQLGLPSPDFFINSQAEPVNEGRAVYRIELDILASTYRGVKAIPWNRQAADSACMAFSISQAGVHTVSGAQRDGGAHCW